jgi:hypothetical protein
VFALCCCCIALQIRELPQTTTSAQVQAARQSL